MKIIVDNLATEYKDEGTGKVLLFLHGWKDSLSSFDPLVEPLSKEYRIIRLDLPGFGKTEMPKGDWDLESYINFVSSFIYKLDLLVYALAGHSFGGRIIIKGIAQGKLKSEKIILIGSAGIAKRKTFKNYFFKVLAKIGKVVTYIPPFYFYRDILKKKLYGFVGSDYFKTGVLKNTFLKVIQEDLGGYAKKINIPALLIWGANDTETPASDGHRLNGMIKDSKLVVIENAGHFVHKEKSEEVVELMRKFL